MQEHVQLDQKQNNKEPFLALSSLITNNAKGITEIPKSSVNILP